MEQDPAAPLGTVPAVLTGAELEVLAVGGRNVKGSLWRCPRRATGAVPVLNPAAGTALEPVLPHPALPTYEGVEDQRDSG